MKKEKQVRTYKRRTKSGKTVIVKAHTAKYDAADKAKEIAKKKGAGEELEERKKKKPTQLEIPFDFDKEGEKKVLDEIKDTEKKASKKVRPVGSGTNGPTPKKKSEEKSTKKIKAETSEPAFTAAEFKEWYRGTGSAADKKVAKALRAQLGRSGYRKLEDEAIDNYSSRGHLSMFKRVSGGSEAKTKTSLGGKAGKSTEPKVTTKTGKSGNKTTDKESKISSKSVARETVSLSSITGDYHKSIINRAVKYAQTDVDKAKDYMKRAGVDPKHQKQILAGNYEVSPERGKEGFIRVGIKKSSSAKTAKEKDTSKPPKFTVSELKKKGWQKVPIGNRRLDNAEGVNKLFYMVSPDKKQMVEVYSNQGRYFVDYPRQATKRVLDKSKNAKTINEGKVPKTFSALKKAGWTYVQTNKGKVGGGVRGYWVSPDRETMVFGGADFRPGKGRSEHVDVDKPKRVTKTILSALDRRK